MKKSVSSSRFDMNQIKKHKSTVITINKVFRDRISLFPDELLVSILSKLNIKEAAMTSILSHRWEKLWISYHGNLSFGATIKLRSVVKSDRQQIMCDHLKSTSQVLRFLLGSFSSPSLNSLILCCPLLKTKLLDFDMIVQFLMVKRIRILELDMYSTDASHATTLDSFSFPAEFYAWVKEPQGLHNLSALTSLSLQNISVSDDTVEYFVSNCPLLERLCVRISNLLSNLRIIGDASLKLKYLEIRYARGMKSLVVSAPNLLSLNYKDDRKIKLDVLNCPKLVEVCLGRHWMTYMSDSLSTYLAQLHTLNLYFGVSLINNFSLLAPPNNVVFSNLKHVVWRVIIREEDESLLGFTSSLVEASPVLEKFTLEAITWVDDSKIGLHNMTTTTTRTRKQYSQNQRLKVVELTNFTGVTPEVELLVHFVENFSSSLEQIIIIIDTSTKYEVSQARKKRGRKLMKHIPPGVAFVLI